MRCLRKIRGCETSKRRRGRRRTMAVRRERPKMLMTSARDFEEKV